MTVRVALLYIVLFSALGIGFSAPAQASDDQHCKAEEAQNNTRYPFAIDRIAWALKRKRFYKEVEVLVIDNGFAGYSKSGAAMLPTDVFPDIFFPRDDTIGRSNPSDGLIGAEAQADRKDWGHGTHVTGIILGGSYGTGKPSQGNRAQPGVRRLLFKEIVEPGQPFDQHLQPIIRVYVAALRKGGVEWDKSRLESFGTDPPKIVLPADFKPQIVNISVKKNFVFGDHQAALIAIPLRFADALVIVSAGNDGRELGEGGHEYPPMSDSSLGNLMVIASHDPSGERSFFSNYHGELVTLAAPGCGINSWFTGEDAIATAASGTTQAAAMVSFAAALLKSRWAGTPPSGLRERLIASSKLDERLEKCLDKSGLRGECVKWGSVLDIEAALYYDTDMIEYCEEDGPGDLPETWPAARGCKTRLALGSLKKVPPQVTICERAGSLPVARNLTLTRPSGIRMRAELGNAGKYQVIYRGLTARQQPELAVCDNKVVATGSFEFDPLPANMQPDELPQEALDLEGKLWHIPPRRVVRLVLGSNKE